MSLDNLPTLLSALDTVLSLHFASSTSIPRAYNLCEKATQLTKRRVDINTLELILALDPKVYKIVHFGANTIDFGVCIPDGISPLSFGALLPQRRRALEDLVSLADGDSLKLRSLSEYAVSREDSRAMKASVLSTVKALQIQKSESIAGPKISSNVLLDHSPKSSIRPSLKICKPELSNNSSKFSLKKVSSSKGLSLVERIKLKESILREQREQNSEKNESSHYVKGKAPGIYDVIYELNSQDTSQRRPYKNISLDKLVSIVKDSFAHSMVEEDIVEAVLIIASALPNSLKVVQVGGIRAIRIHELNRDRDLKLLKKL